jgi:sporulation protein YlmC with PRC-barrel domain
MNDKDFINKPVIAMADGAKVGTVKDLVFQGLELASLVIKGERGEGLLPYASIGKNGPDAITIESFTLVDWNAGRALAPDSRNTHELRKLAVMDADGNNLGHMDDFTMNAKGHVEDIVVRTQGVFGIGSQETVVSHSKVRAIGPEIITVERVGKN